MKTRLVVSIIITWLEVGILHGVSRPGSMVWQILYILHALSWELFFGVAHMRYVHTVSFGGHVLRILVVQLTSTRFMIDVCRERE